MGALVDDVFFSNPKVARLSKDAKLLYIAGLCYCARHLTDGVLTRKAVKIVQVEADAKPRHVAELAEEGFWDRLEDGYIVHDYRDMNPRTAEEIKQRRRELSEKRREAGLKGAQSRWSPNGKHGKPHSKSHSNEPQSLPMAPSLPKEDQKPLAASLERVMNQARKAAAAERQST